MFLVFTDDLNETTTLKHLYSQNQLRNDCSSFINVVQNHLNDADNPNSYTSEDDDHELKSSYSTAGSTNEINNEIESHPITPIKNTNTETTENAFPSELPTTSHQSPDLIKKFDKINRQSPEKTHINNLKLWQISKFQINQLQKFFNDFPYPSAWDVSKLANSLELTEDQVRYSKKNQYMLYMGKSRIS